MECRAAGQAASNVCLLVEQLVQSLGNLHLWEVQFGQLDELFSMA